MGDLPGGSSDNLVRRAISRSTARRAAEWPPSRIAAVATELKDALAREAALLRDKDEILQRQVMLTQEFEHRLANSLQLIVTLLSLQSRKTESPEAAAQLLIAAGRVGAIGRVHRQLHLLDLLDTVELKQYVARLCEDISGMLFDGEVPHPVVVEGAQIQIPTALGIPLGFIVNELITNAAKHGKGRITVKLETTPEHGHCISVSNGGPGLPDGFYLGSSKRVGLRIVVALVEQINGRLQLGPCPGQEGAGQEGACFKVFFPSTAAV